MTKKKCTQESGTCPNCRSACASKPGWFKPGEVERVAEYMGLSLLEFFNKYLMVDWWVDEQDVYVLSPAIVEADPGQEFPRDPRGTCIFFKDNLCTIHPVKPYECRTYWCGLIEDEPTCHNKEVVDGWRKHQDQVSSLLGREPESQGSWGLLDELGGYQRWIIAGQ